MADDDNTNPPATGDDDGNVDDNDLRPEGEKALEAWKQRAKDAERVAKDAGATAKERDQLRTELEQLREKSKTQDEKEREKLVKEAEERVRKETLTTTNARLVRYEMRARAAGKLTNIDDAERFLDVSEFKVSDDGDVDGASIDKAIDALIAERPYLSGKQKPKGDVDQGARGDGKQEVAPGRARMAAAYAESSKK